MISLLPATRSPRQDETAHPSTTNLLQSNSDGPESWAGETRNQNPSGFSDFSRSNTSVNTSPLSSNFPRRERGYPSNSSSSFSPSPSLPGYVDGHRFNSYTPSSPKPIHSLSPTSTRFLRHDASSSFSPSSHGKGITTPFGSNKERDLYGLGLSNLHRAIDSTSTANQGRESNTWEADDHFQSTPNSTNTPQNGGEEGETPLSEVRSIRSVATVDEDFRSNSWEAPDMWRTNSPSPRTSPIPFSERRLSKSLAQNMDTITSTVSRNPSGSRSSRTGSRAHSRQPTHHAGANMLALEENQGEDDEGPFEAIDIETAS